MSQADRYQKNLQAFQAKWREASRNPLSQNDTDILVAEAHHNGLSFKDIGEVMGISYQKAAACNKRQIALVDLASLRMWTGGWR